MIRKNDPQELKSSSNQLIGQVTGHLTGPRRIQLGHGGASFPYLLKL
jgi:hypothetical protein